MADTTPRPANQVLIVRYGTRSTHRSDVYLNHGVYREDDGPIDMDYFFWAIRTPDETILVDTGFSVAGGEARGRTILIDPARALALAGAAVLIGSCIVALHDNLQLGAVYWSAYLMAAVLLITGLHAYAERWMVRVVVLVSAVLIMSIVIAA